MSVYKAENVVADREALECPVCHFNSNLWVRLPAVSLYRCVKCDHCFTDISSMAQEESYDSDYYLMTHRNWFENPNYPLFSLLATEILSHGAKKVLDVGCGNGAFLKYLANTTEGLELHGIDLSDAAEQVVSIKFLKGNFLTFDFQTKFDAVVTLAVIEHLSDVSSFVRRIHELLNKDGMACVMTLNENGVLYRFANFLRKVGFPSVFVRLYDPHHVNHFSKDSLERLLTRDGLFRVLKVIDRNTPLAAIDVPATNPVRKWAMKLGVAAVFFAGKITKKTYLQTFVVSKVG
jgi:2-polyprenyl-3-methyl-5-hydroxy-6-metoxy-1,4-benzoquinol methylase